MKIRNLIQLFILVISIAVTAVAQAENSPYLGAVAINVTDLSKSTAFYTEMFELTVKRSYNNETMDENILGSKSSSGSSIVLVQNKNKDNTNNGSTRLVFYVGDANKIVLAAKEMGATVIREPKIIPGTSTTMGLIRDLDGYAIELIQRASEK